MKKIIIIGNKPYVNLPLNNIIDSFDLNYRCNLGLPNRNNGTKYNNLGLCNHLYENLITKKANRENFFKKYGNVYHKDYINSYLNTFQENKEKYNNIFHARFRPALYNDFLKKHNCPYRFSKLPRTGYTIIFENLLKGNSVFVSNFSIKTEERVSYYVNKDKFETESHNASDEINILRWLHQKKFIDATICFLKDSKNPILECGDLSPSDFIVEKLIQEFGEVKIS